MKTILDLNSTEAKSFFLKNESYCSFELPEYFSFQKILDILTKELSGKTLEKCTDALKPKDAEGVNYVLLNNKDGRYAWRPFQLIHPAIYVFLVQELTKTENWQLIKDRFKLFYSNNKIECHSIPVTEENRKSDKQNQILTW